MVNEVVVSWSKGSFVRLIDNPGRTGVTTGRTRSEGLRVLVQIKFGPNDAQWFPENTLELCAEDDDGPGEAVIKGALGKAADLRRLIVLEKVTGRLSDVFYSMESSNTDFFPHQFKPVLKFLDSPRRRLLIADEVGLGKTIEAMFIWKELQARDGAQRLLIVCPAMLREKWRDDLRVRFNIRAQIVDAPELHKALSGPDVALEEFVLIASLEGTRPGRKWEEDDRPGPRNAIAHLLDKAAAGGDRALLDMVVIDESHYLRNPETMNHKLARLLRDASAGLLLLTATPIQTHNSNMYNLLRLVDDEVFFNESAFDNLLSANAPIVSAQRRLWGNDRDLSAALEAVDTALDSELFAENPILASVRDQLGQTTNLNVESRIRLGRDIERCSLFSQYLTRTRKRDALKDRVRRTAQTLTVELGPTEMQVYERVTRKLREQARDVDGPSLFRLFSRQRQMASCMVAAVDAWNTSSDMSELLYEDLGQGPEESSDEQVSPLQDLTVDIPQSLRERLIAEDTKYQRLVGFLKQELKGNRKERFVLFAFFRGTLQYLQSRLEQDGITCGLMLGGMGEQKWEIIREFGSDRGPSVLLSSEVGSEGIDLQFCRFIINYDLPWNPMRVEQRIGRLDRLGQKAERISIINFSLQGTIEEKILGRLYDRIRIFQESIGDLEEILGPATEKLLRDFVNPELSDEERVERATQTAEAVANARAEQERLEEEAVNLVAFSDYLMQVIHDARERGRWLQSSEVIFLISDYFSRYYPGTVISDVVGAKGVYDVELSAAAKSDLSQYLTHHPWMRRRTRLNLAGPAIRCFVDPRESAVTGKGYELIDQTHPLLQWVAKQAQAQGMRAHPACAIRLRNPPKRIRPGDYVFVMHKWQLEGLRSEVRLVCRAARLEDGRILSERDSELLLDAAMGTGRDFPNAVNHVDMESVSECVGRCTRALDHAYHDADDDFRAENEQRCRAQERSAKNYAEKRGAELAERLRRFEETGQKRMIPATKGLAEKNEQELRVKIARIQRSRAVQSSMKEVAAGLIRAEEPT